MLSTLNIQCDGKRCGQGKHVGAGSYICPHKNLKILYPDICNEWDYEKNTNIPDQYSAQSGKEVHWICKNNWCGCHKWSDTIHHRIGSNRGCPYCSHQRLCLHNNLYFLYPELCQEWDYERNSTIPTQYPPGSKEKVYWICKNNWCGCHKWPAQIYNRVNGSGCPFCNNKTACHHNNIKYLYPGLCEEWDYERNSSRPEQYLPGSGETVWWICKNNWCGCHRWSAQIKHRVGRSDGCPYCSNRILCEHNNLTLTHPELCREWSSNNQTTPSQHSYGSHAMINWVCINNRCGCHLWPDTINHRTGGRGCPFCGHTSICPHNNLKYLYPELCKEWDYERNLIGPDQYLPGSNVIVNWICKNNWCGCHVWPSTIYNRVGNHSGCPYCSNNKPCIHNNLKVSHPELCEEWDPENTTTPDQYSTNSGVKVKWICRVKSNHKWRATINARVGRQSGCPHCAVSRGYSRSQIGWLDSVMLEQNIIIQYALSPDGEFKISNVGKVDGYCSATNTVYEYHGDYWHGNPSIFDFEDINQVNHKTFGELYQKTIIRDNKIRSLGYNLIVKWETSPEIMISFNEANIKLNAGEFWNFKFLPEYQTIPHKEENYIGTFNGKDGGIYLVELQYDESTNTISSPI
jgi:hypothetical protein